MKKNLLKCIAGFSIILVLAFSANPPNGRTGAPGDGLCSDCHSSSAQTGNVMIQDVPASVMPGQTYTITVLSTTTSSSVLAGFQMVALHDDGNINAGSMSNPSAGSTVTVVGSGRSYHEHNPAQPFGGGDMVSWTVDWTAPMTGPNGDITFYAANVLANGNSTNQGDGVVTTNVSGSFMSLPPLMGSVSLVNGVSCNGDTDGSATATASGGVMPYSYLWTSGESSPTAMMLAGGMQSVTITDDAGQNIVRNITIPEPAPIDPSVVVDQHVSCFGLADGQLTANASGGSTPYTYLWSDGQTTVTADGLIPGSYSVTITDANSCTAIGTETINEPDLLTASIISQTDVTCFGFADGSAFVEATGGTTPYSYLWSDGQTSANAINLGAGLYTLTVTDANSCENTAMVTISEPTQLMSVINAQQNVSCFGGNDGSAQAAGVGGTGPYSYLWSDGQTTETATMLAAGTYTCMVTDDNGCQSMVSVNITQPTEITINLNISNESAQGAGDGSITAAALGGMSPYDYDWSNGETGATIENLTAGNYTVTVTDANGCTQTATGTVLAPGCDLTVAIITVSDLECPNGMDAILTYEANDTVASVLWSTGATSDTIADLGGGTYGITVTDSDGCSAMSSIVLIAADTMAPTWVLDTVCLFIDDDGMAVLDSQMFYGNIIDNCDPTPTATFTPVLVDCDDTGIFSVNYLLVDNVGNTNPTTLYIIVSDTTRPSIDCPSDITVSTCGVVNYSLPTGMDNCDSVAIELVSGMGSGQVFPVGTTTETYRAVDQFGNQTFCSFNVTVISDLDVVITSTDVTCAGGSDGSALIQGVGGTAPYSFTIDPDVDIFMMPAGSYIVMLTDSVNCVAVDTVTISEPDAIELDTLIVTDATAGNFDGSIEITVSGGVAPYSFIWFLDSMMYSTNEDIFNLFPGYYSLLITDDTGCTAQFDSILVDEMVSTIEISDLSKRILIYEYSRTIFLQPSIDVGDYTFELYNSNGQIVTQDKQLNGERQINVQRLPAGYYIIRVTNEKGENATKSIILR